MNQSKVNLSIGIALMIAGVIMVVSSLVVVIKHRADIRSSIQAAKSSVNASDLCESTFKRMGFEVTPWAGGGLSIKKSLEENVDNEFTKASLGIVACKGFVLKNFCAGTKCPDHQLSLELLNESLEKPE